MAALNRASREGVGAIVRVGGRDVEVLPIRYLELLERLIQQEEDRVDAEDADRILDDPTDTAVPYEQFRKELGLPDLPDRDPRACQARDPGVALENPGSY